jgi:hypothetical protein
MRPNVSLKEELVTATACTAVCLTDTYAGGLPLAERWNGTSWSVRNAAAQIYRPEAGYRPGSDRGSPNHGSTLLSKRVMAPIRSPVRVIT